MLYVSIFVELLRSRPALAVGFATLAQTLLWTLVPTLFYSGPPGDLPNVLAIGHEFQLGTYLGPPLAFWLAEVAFDLARGSLFGVYALAQICIALTYWAVFSLGRAIVGAQQAALAVLLMAGVAAFTVPTPDFGPMVLSMPLWAIILLHYWRAVGEHKRAYWLALAAEVGLLLMTTYMGLVLIGLLVLFTFIDERARKSLNSYDPLIAVMVASVVAGPHIIWLVDSNDGLLHLPVGLRGGAAILGSFGGWLRQLGLIVAAHAGLLVLVALAAGYPWPVHEPAPVIMRPKVDPFARRYVYFFAIAPALAGTILAVIMGWSGPVGGIAPLIILSGLAIVVAAGEGIALNRQHIVIAAWFGLLIIPPAMAASALLVLPWLGVDLRVTQPAHAMGQFFSDSFERRTGKPLKIVGGDARTAGLIALASRDRPSVFFDGAPEYSPWVSPDAVDTKGAVLVWPTSDTAGTPPPVLMQQFPDLVPEVPRVFERRVQGRLPPLRLGWAVVRPKAKDAGALGESR